MLHNCHLAKFEIRCYIRFDSSVRSLMHVGIDVLIISSNNISCQQIFQSKISISQTSFSKNVFRMNMCSVYNSRNELGVIWIWYLACYHVALIKIVFHIFKANAYLVFSVYNNELHTLHYIHAFRSHLSVFESKFVSNEQCVDINPNEIYYINLYILDSVVSYLFQQQKYKL